MRPFATVLIALTVTVPTPLASQVVINETVTDPQFDWGDSTMVNGMPFDASPTRAGELD